MENQCAAYPSMRTVTMVRKATARRGRNMLLFFFSEAKTVGLRVDETTQKF